MKKATVCPSDVDLKLNGIEALNKSLGPSGAMRFLSLLQREPTDYVAISRRLYRNQTVDGIFSRARSGVKK
ncbi:MAG: hypothetical protein PHV34_20995 [Verrucomicrobiae bacterium]|nr:hypothetical protein [Verrucomicrobiae bacterium]